VSRTFSQVIQSTHIQFGGYDMLDSFAQLVQNSSGKKNANAVDSAVIKKYDEEINQLRSKLKDFQSVSQSNKDLQNRVKEV
jgi:hypothetical protein